MRAHTVREDPIYLSYGEMNNLSSLNSSGVAQIMQSIYPYLSVNASNSITVVNVSLQLPYGVVSHYRRYYAPGSKLHFITYNQNSTLTVYNVSVSKATPVLRINVDGASVSEPNSTVYIHVPFLPGQKSYSIPVNLQSSLAGNNTAGFAYSVRSGATVTNQGTYHSGNLQVPISLNLLRNQSLTIEFSTGGNANYTPVDPIVQLIPTPIVEYLPITITNSQTSATSSPFEQLLTVNSLAYAQYENGDLSNIEFFYENGIIVNSWMQFAPSNTATNTIYWLSINGIPSSSSETIYMGFAPLGTNVFNTATTGEAPQLSSVYGQYDDGKSVFLYYDDQKTTSQYTLVNSGAFAITTMSTPYSQTENVLKLNGKGSGSQTIAWLTNPLIGDNVIDEGWVNIASSDSATEQANGMFLFRGASSSSTTDYSAGIGWTGADSALTKSGTTLSTSGTRAAGWWWLYAYISGSSIYEATYSGEPLYVPGNTLKSTIGPPQTRPIHHPIPILEYLTGPEPQGQATSMNGASGTIHQAESCPPPP